MPVLLKLTTINLKPIWVNMQNVIFIVESDNFGSRLSMRDNAKIYVMESPDKIVDLLPVQSHRIDIDDFEDCQLLSETLIKPEGEE